MHRRPSPTPALKTLSQPRKSKLYRHLLLTLAILLASIGGIHAQDGDESRWGPIAQIARADQVEAPALSVSDGRWVTAWVALNQEGPLQYQRLLTSTLAISPDPELEHLPIPPFAPREQTLLDAQNSSYHLLWLDSAWDAPQDGTRLWTAMLTVDGTLQRGEIPLSDRPTYRYDALKIDPQFIRVVWSEGLAAEPELFTRLIDADGRPRLAERIISNGDWPTLLAENGGRLHLFWQTGSVPHEVLHALLVDGRAQQTRAILLPPILEPGDRLVDFSAAVDMSHAYLLWNIQRGGGDAEVWYSSSPLSGGHWTAPTQLAIAVDETQAMITGFNGGSASMATSGSQPAAWASVLRGQFDYAVIAAQVGEALGLIYLQAGQIRGFQPVVTLATPGLIGKPMIQTDRERHLTLAWSQPVPDAPARLSLTSTRN